MNFTITIAESRDILRTGLSTIFASDKRVAHITEVRTEKELQDCLHTHSQDLIIVNHSLITDMTILPRGRFVILVEQFDMRTFLAAFNHGARGYLLENTPADLLRATLYISEKAFLLEPTLTAQLVEYISGDSRLAVKEALLTPREKEIVHLLRQGIDRSTIARQLHISDATLKTHIKNITRKREKLPSLSTT